ncbi:MAG: hypothetical protein R3Y56_10355 [Akkermansia sp.]
MKLRDKLLEILPTLLPQHESEAIKGKELIKRVRAVLGDSYSDQSLRSQFSFLVLEEESCLARVENGQGYYLRDAVEDSSLHNMFGAEVSPDADDPYRKALALAVRLYDSAGHGVFVYPIEEDESWSHADFVAVTWPSGSWEDGAYLFDDAADEQPQYRAVCVAVADSDESCRKAFFRALACGSWAQQSELLLLGTEDLPEDELCELAARYGVGVRALAVDGELLDAIGGADLLFRADVEEARSLLEQVPQRALASARSRALRLPSEQSRPDVAALVAWVDSCLQKGRVESYELRVALG